MASIGTNAMASSRAAMQCEEAGGEWREYQACDPTHQLRRCVMRQCLD